MCSRSRDLFTLLEISDTISEMVRHRHIVATPPSCFVLEPLLELLLYFLQSCKLPENNADGSKLICRMPVLSLPDDLSQQLNENETGTINDTHGPGVAVYFSSDGRTRADIYLGLVLDGYRLYENISSVDPSVKMQFSIPPDILCGPADDLEFDPAQDKVVRIRVNRGL